MTDGAERGSLRAMPLDLLPRPLPLLTADLPGTGGTIKITPEDFIVDELPAYLPSGDGQHLYVLVEKRQLTTQDAVRLIAAAADIPERDIGYAGQKDRQALSRQWLSLATAKDAIHLDHPRLRILETSRHGNKLRLGHSKGNRFTLVIRDTTPDAETRAHAILDRLAKTGLANFFGPQRFGKHKDNAVLGAALINVGNHPRTRHASHDRHLRRLALSALQSELFNRCLAARIDDDLYDQVIAGDVLQRRNGGLFNTTDVALDTTRVLAHEVDITGSLPGPRERPEARDSARDREDAVLAAAGISRAAFANGRGEAEGARRPYRVPLVEVTVRTVTHDSIELSFPLPPGSYATRVIAEIAKTDVDVPE